MFFRQARRLGGECSPLPYMWLSQIEIASQLIFGIFELESVWIELEEAHLLVLGASRGDENRARERVSQMEKNRNSHTKGESNQTLNAFISAPFFALTRDF